MWDKITYPFPNFNGAAVEVWEWISNFISHSINSLRPVQILGHIKKKYNFELYFIWHVRSHCLNFQQESYV